MSTAMEFDCPLSEEQKEAAEKAIEMILQVQTKIKRSDIEELERVINIAGVNLPLMKEFKDPWRRIEYGRRITSFKLIQNSFLELAIRIPNRPVIEYLCSRNDLEVDGYLPLHWATYRNVLDVDPGSVLDILLKANKFNLDAKDERGKTFLYSLKQNLTEQEYKDCLKKWNEDTKIRKTKEFQSLLDAYFRDDHLLNSAPLPPINFEVSPEWSSHESLPFLEDLLTAFARHWKKHNPFSVDYGDDHQIEFHIQNRGFFGFVLIFLLLNQESQKNILQKLCGSMPFPDLPRLLEESAKADPCLALRPNLIFAFYNYIKAKLTLGQTIEARVKLGQFFLSILEKSKPEILSQLKEFFPEEKSEKPFDLTSIQVKVRSIDDLNFKQKFSDDGPFLGSHIKPGVKTNEMEQAYVGKYKCEGRFLPCLIISTKEGPAVYLSPTQIDGEIQVLSVSDEVMEDLCKQQDDLPLAHLSKYFYDSRAVSSTVEAAFRKFLPSFSERNNGTLAFVFPLIEDAVGELKASYGDSDGSPKSSTETFFLNAQFDNGPEVLGIKSEVAATFKMTAEGLKFKTTVALVVQAAGLTPARKIPKHFYGLDLSSCCVALGEAVIGKEKLPRPTKIIDYRKKDPRTASVFSAGAGTGSSGGASASAPMS